jgi:hypothetical protein
MIKALEEFGLKCEVGQKDGWILPRATSWHW